MANTQPGSIKPPALYDRYLIFAVVAIIGIGLLMVASSSMVISSKTYGQPFYYLIHQLAYIVVGLILSWQISRFKVTQWQMASPNLLLASLLLLALVLIPGIGHQVNGSMRWLSIGPVGVQVSEIAKFSMILYLAGYIVRRRGEVQTKMRGFLKPLLVLGVMSILLLKEPDFGAMTVIVTTSLGILFLAGVRLWQFTVLFCIAATLLIILAVSSPYRLQRLTTFMDPWAHAYASGYQLTQSLIAFGRGGWFGVGLGKSVQKLFYLPEAQTDFLFAILTEELGLIGACVVIGLFCLLVIRAFFIGFTAHQQKQYFSAYVAYGIGLWVGLQAMINMGVNMGILPTKGLTLPLMSYGGSSMLVNFITMTLLLRIDYETRVRALGLQREI